MILGYTMLVYLFLIGWTKVLTIGVFFNYPDLKVGAMKIEPTGALAQTKKLNFL